MDVNELISPEHIRNEVERLFNAVVSSCGNISLVLDYIPFGGQAGGEDIIGGGGTKVEILTIPQLEGAWQKVAETFREPWFKFPQIKKYIEQNDLIKFLINDDCDTKSQVMLEFKDLLVNWGYNEVMNAVNKKVKPITSAATEQPKRTIKVQKPIKKPLHKNKPFIGGIGITAAAYVIQFAHAHLPASVAALIAGIVTMILAVVEHKNVYEIKEELQEI